jgi:predicted ribosomally synthesized peptide with nif11-like leader
LEDKFMSAELKSFLQRLSTKPELLAELRSLLQDSDAAIRWAGERGCHVTPDEIAEMRDSEQDLSDDDLDQAAGGAWPPP